MPMPSTQDEQYMKAALEKRRQDAAASRQPPRRHPDAQKAVDDAWDWEALIQIISDYAYERDEVRSHISMAIDRLGDDPDLARSHLEDAENLIAVEE